MATRATLTTTLATTRALIEQFVSSLSTTPDSAVANETANTPSPLLLLSAVASALKSHVTKLSLLSITAPFTPSAVSTNLGTLNDAILPSLATAALLITSAQFTLSFATESTSLARTIFRDLDRLVALVERRNQDGMPEADLSMEDKRSITEATAKVWEDCDELAEFANTGFAGFVTRKATQWLDLMKDAVKELQEWDPEEDNEDDLFGEDQSAAGSDEGRQVNEKEELDASVTIKAGVKTEVLKVLTRIPQSIHVVIKQRLARVPDVIQLSSVQRDTIDTTLTKTRVISDCIDESAECIYTGDPEGCLKKAGEARQITIEVVESMLQPWTSSPASQPTKEDQYLKRALDWIRQVNATGRTNR